MYKDKNYQKKYREAHKEQWAKYYKNQIDKINIFCIDCGKKITNKKCKRCLSCDAKNKWKLGILKGSSYIDGRSLKENHCIDCGKIIVWRAKRCYVCASSGQNSHNWHGGISKVGYSYIFNNDLKESLRKRDDYKCQNCGMTEEEHLIAFERVLSIHHIDYNKENCNENNLVTLCQPCNIEANFNRSYWQEFYKSILIKKGV